MRLGKQLLPFTVIATAGSKQVQTQMAPGNMPATAMQQDLLDLPFCITAMFPAPQDPPTVARPACRHQVTLLSLLGPQQAETTAPFTPALPRPLPSQCAYYPQQPHIPSSRAYMPDSAAMSTLWSLLFKVASRISPRVLFLAAACLAARSGQGVVSHRGSA